LIIYLSKKFFVETNSDKHPKEAIITIVISFYSIFIP